jgi:hypothetical protein
MRTFSADRSSIARAGRGRPMQLPPRQAGGRRGLQDLQDPLLPVEELATVVLDHPAQLIYRDSPEHLSQYRSLFERLKGSALPPIAPSTEPEAQSVTGSLMLIQHLLYDL